MDPYAPKGRSERGPRETTDRHSSSHWTRGLGKFVPLDIVFGGASAERDVLRSPEWLQGTLSGPNWPLARDNLASRARPGNGTTS